MGKHMKNNFLRFAGFVLTLFLFAFGTDTDSPLKILAVGDSITEGGKRGVEEYTYRLSLQEIMYKAGVPFDFLGSKVEGLDPGIGWPEVLPGLAFDPHHESYYGQTTRFVCDKVMENYSKLGQHPDIVLVHLGTNDRKHGDFEVSVAQPLRELIAFLREQNEEVAILLGHLNFNNDPTVDQIRSWVERVATETNSSVSPVRTVHHYKGWHADPESVYADTFDWAHPNMKGQQKMAENWWEVMQQLPQLKRPIHLFNGKDLEGWHVDVPALDKKNDSIKSPFTVRDGMLISKGEPRGHLITNASYNDYELTFDYRFEAEPGNCGVLVHAATPRALYDMFPKSIEVQMMHENAGDFWCIVEDIKVDNMEERRGPKNEWGITEGKKRRIANLTDNSEKPLGEWNHMKIRCEQHTITVWVNGVLVNHGFDCTATEGQIALQAEGAQVAFKGLVLQPITAN